jgi:hypothetical protein
MKEAVERQGDTFILRGLERQELSAVVFVRDYYQLQFDGPRLTLVTPPEVLFEDVKVDVNAPGYRDRLCSLIGRRVVRASVRPGHALCVVFSDGVAVEVSLRAESYRAAEAVIFDGPDGKQWAAW